jgi:ureidoacrylate peracid hydrolase
MIKHVVLAKVKSGVSQKQIDAMLAGYNSMKNAIPELVSWSMGPNLYGNGEFTHVMVAVFENLEALKSYVEHPLHQRVSAELGRPIFETRVIGDYEFDPEAESWEPQVQTVWTELIDMVRPQHTALLVIDVQNDFCSPGGARMKGDLTTIEGMKEPTRRIVEAARVIGVPVVYTQTQNDAEHDNGPILARRQRVGLGGAKYTIPGTWGWKIAEFVAPHPGEVSIPKWHHSGFTNPKMDATLRRLGAKTLVFTGIATNGCVEATVRDAFARGYYAVVLEDCVGAYDLELQRYSLKNMATHFALISSSREVQNSWNQSRSIANKVGQSVAF